MFMQCSLPEKERARDLQWQELYRLTLSIQIVLNWSGDPIKRNVFNHSYCTASADGFHCSNRCPGHRDTLYHSRTPRTFKNTLKFNQPTRNKSTVSPGQLNTHQPARARRAYLSGKYTLRNTTDPTFVSLHELETQTHPLRLNAS